MYREGLLPRSSLELRVVAPKCVSLKLVEACESQGFYCISMKVFFILISRMSACDLQEKIRFFFFSSHLTILSVFPGKICQFFNIRKLKKNPWPSHR
jgi:hypothetical protein